MAKNRVPKPELTPDPKADALADVYLFLLRKAAERNHVDSPNHAKLQTAEAGSSTQIFEQKSVSAPKVRRKNHRR